VEVFEYVKQRIDSNKDNFVNDNRTESNKERWVYWNDEWENLLWSVQLRSLWRYSGGFLMADVVSVAMPAGAPVVVDGEDPVFVDWFRNDFKLGRKMRDDFWNYMIALQRKKEPTTTPFEYPPLGYQSPEVEFKYTRGSHRATSVF
jgi:hypothetical protein